MHCEDGSAEANAIGEAQGFAIFWSILAGFVTFAISGGVSVRLVGDDNVPGVLCVIGSMLLGAIVCFCMVFLADVRDQRQREQTRAPT